MDEDDADGQKVEWHCDSSAKQPHQANSLSFGRVKKYLYESLHRSITTHRLAECYQLLYVLPREITLDPYVLFRFIFILLESNDTKQINKNVISYLESLLSKLDVCSPDVFVEFLAFYLRHDRLDDAIELYDSRQRYMSSKIHRNLPFLNINLNCYGFLLKYLSWDKRISSSDSKVPFDKSIQGWIVNAIDCLKTTTSNHEYFVMCVVRVLIHYRYFRKAYLFTSEFQRNNPLNLGAQLLHLHVIKRLTDAREEELEGQVPMICDISETDKNRKRSRDLKKINNFAEDTSEEVFDPNRYPIDQDKKNILSNLRQLDCSSNELVELADLHDNYIDVFTDLMDGMEVVSEIRNMERWRNLKSILEKILASDDRIIITDACFLWLTRYRLYWRSIDFISLAGERISRKDKKLIEKVTSMLKTHLERPIRLS